ncbi:hypothetical protein H6G97_04535 [Nostoc flagelliforme FACHB-838]|uniref:Transposase n=1 Tax=Nostoc flagelliforme FACHB-838 TaxID=2692904 RepID=A0ABR8DIS9_9NOSO|nr:hypothetical protein [Nostoc flagelliforme FACHB-838]
MSTMGKAYTPSAILKLKCFGSKAMKECMLQLDNHAACRALYEKSRRWSFWWR